MKQQGGQRYSTRSRDSGVVVVVNVMNVTFVALICRTKHCNKCSIQSIALQQNFWFLGLEGKMVINIAAFLQWNEVVWEKFNLKLGLCIVCATFGTGWGPLMTTRQHKAILKMSLAFLGAKERQNCWRCWSKCGWIRWNLRSVDRVWYLRGTTFSCGFTGQHPVIDAWWSSEVTGES